MSVTIKEFMRNLGKIALAFIFLIALVGSCSRTCSDAIKLDTERKILEDGKSI